MAYLVLASPANVPAEVDLFLGELVPGERLAVVGRPAPPAEHVVELLHGGADDLVHGEGDVHALGDPLVPAQPPRPTLLTVRLREG